MSDLNTWQFIQDKLGQEQTVVLLIVASSQPPAPGRAGFKMAVSADGTAEGTIGGGAVERQMVDLAREKIRAGDAEPLVRALAHGHPPDAAPAPDASPSGMICGGGQTIVMWTMRFGEISIVSRIVDDLEAGRPFRFLLSHEGIAHAPGDDRSGTDFTAPSPGTFQFTENLSPSTVYIIGGGHVALALSEVLSRLDFRIVVLDNRPDAPTMAENRFAHRKKTIDYIDVAGEVPDGPDNYIVIMTPSHEHDEEVLGRLIRKKSAYLGMMASPPKARKIFANLKDAGISEESLQKVRAPIGLPIHSHTAPEIAISIAAELISVKNGKDKQP